MNEMRGVSEGAASILIGLSLKFHYERLPLSP